MAKNRGSKVQREKSAARPSTVRRLARMQTLIAQLARTDMDSIDIAAYLRCSHTAARGSTFLERVDRWSRAVKFSGKTGVCASASGTVDFAHPGNDL